MKIDFNSVLCMLREIFDGTLIIENEITEDYYSFIIKEVGYNGKLKEIASFKTFDKVNIEEDAVVRLAAYLREIVFKRFLQENKIKSEVVNCTIDELFFDEDLPDYKQMNWYDKDELKFIIITDNNIKGFVERGLSTVEKIISVSISGENKDMLESLIKLNYGIHFTILGYQCTNIVIDGIQHFIKKWPNKLIRYDEVQN